eukprot:3939387-Rhodomonas_salina.3
MLSGGSERGPNGRGERVYCKGLIPYLIPRCTMSGSQGRCYTAKSKANGRIPGIERGTGGPVEGSRAREATVGSQAPKRKRGEINCKQLLLPYSLYPKGDSILQWVSATACAAGEMDMLKEEGDSTLLRSQGTLTMGLRVVSTDVVYGGTSMSLGVAPSCASTDGARSLSYVPRRSS